WEHLALPLRSRLLVSSDALGFYLWKLAWPLHLGVDYGRTPAVALADPIVRLVWLIPAVLLATACWWWRRRRDAAPLASILLFIIGVGPVLGLVPFDFQVYSTVADHYVYLA